MKILSIETATMLGGVALIDDSTGLIAEIRLNVQSTHSERLMTGMDYIFKQSGMTISDIDSFALSIGPGSFTGLRIGLSTVKGLSFATGKPIVSVPTLEALAWNFPYCRYPVCTMLDARKEEVYVAMFLWDKEGFRRLMNEISVKIFNLAETILPIVDKELIFTGEGSLLYKDEIEKWFGGKAIFASPEKIVPSPANVARIGIAKALRGEFSEPADLAPFYIRKSEAEIKRDGQNSHSRNANS